MPGWIALAVVVAAGAYVVIRLLRSWGVAGRRYGGEAPRDEPPPTGPPGGSGPASP